MNRFARTFALGAVLAAGIPSAADAVPHAGDPAPAFTIPRAGGGTVSLASFKGKPVYVNFFASWCGPCNEEAGAVGDLSKKYRSRGLAVVGVNYLEDKSSALAFAHKYSWPFAVGLDDGNVGRDYGVVGLPVHVFIDRQGRISTLRFGEMDPAAIESAIKKIL